MTSIEWVLLLGVLLIIVGLPFVSFDWLRDTRLDDQITAIVARKNGIMLPVSSKQRKTTSQATSFTRRVGELVTRSGILSGSNLSDIKAAVRLAGFRDNSAYTILIGTKIVGAIGLPLVFGLTGLSFRLPLIAVAILAVTGLILGLLMPEWSLRFFRSRYEAAVQDALPDTLDLLVICVDSGLGLESALTRVAAEIQHGYPVLSAEIKITSQDLQINPDVEAALKNFANRVQISGISRLVNTLVQSIVYGTPLSKSLHILSGEMRQETLAAFEERATKLPTKMTVPMILFILPALMTIIMGPALHNVLATMSNMSK